MDRLTLPESKLVKTRCRLFETRDADYPHLTASDWVRVAQYGGFGSEQKFEDHNDIMLSSLIGLAAVITNDVPAMTDNRWYRQAVGTGNAPTTNTMLQLDKELIRSSFTELIRIGNVVTSNTFFNAAAFNSAYGTVQAGGSTTVFTLFGNLVVEGLSNPLGLFNVGDTIRVGMPTGYEYAKIQSLSGTFSGGLVITTVAPLTAIPPVNTTVDQMVEEAGLFGNPTAAYQTGTVTVAGGSATVVGAGTAWLANVKAPDALILTTSGYSPVSTMYPVDTVVNDTNLTLHAVYPGSNAAGLTYKLRGSLVNRVVGLHYKKLSGRGFVLENQWTFLGA